MTDPYRCECGQSLTRADETRCAECLAPTACETCGVCFPRWELYAGSVGLECSGCETRRCAAADRRQVAVGISQGRDACLLAQMVTR